HFMFTRSLLPDLYALSLHDALPIFFALWFGCAKAGLILVPLNWRLAVPELETILADAQPAALIYGNEFEPTALELHHLQPSMQLDRKSTRLNSSHVKISYAVFCVKK